MYKTIIYILITIISVSCINPSHQKKDELTITDILGRSVSIPKKINKVIGLRAGTLRLLLYCGAKNMIAGIEEIEKKPGRLYMDINPKLKELPVIGPAMGGDAELILKAKPDVIFISYTTTADANALQKKTGIPVIAIKCAEFATEKNVLFDSFRLIGKVINKTNRVDSLIDFINSSIEDLNIKTKNIHPELKPSVYIGGVPYSGAHGIQSTQPFYPPFIFTNTTNVASAIDKSLISHVKGTFIDKEQLLLWNPDFIFIDKAGLNIVKNDLSSETALFQNLKAIQNNQVYTLYPYNNYAINYEMTLVNAWYLASIIYPKHFNDINFNLKAQEILNTFFNDSIDTNFITLNFNKLNNTYF
ncbi:MAG: iron ABC transporter substrate-binding protein [Marinilabiliaceae bacterium]|nr:iron ABC transporter substrate-binding protein [Marinilabiliaceae bacterium]